MVVRRRTAHLAAAVGVVAVGLWPVTPAVAHGAPTNPLSRTAACAGGDAATAKSAICRKALAANGGAFGNFDNLRVPGINGRDRALIPDGKLCSGGLADYKGLDVASADWPSTRLVAGSTLSMRYRSTIPHPGSFRLYLTKAGYDPQRPLRWADLDSKPFLTVKDPPLRAGAFRMSGKLPANRVGRQLLYTVWQTTDSTDTYYSCSDLVLTRAAPAAPAATGGSGTSKKATASRDGGAKSAAVPGRAASPTPSATGASSGDATSAGGTPVLQPGAQGLPDGADTPSRTPESNGAGRHESWLTQARNVADEHVSRGKQLVTAALIVLVGVSAGFAFTRIRASRAQRVHRSRKNL